VVKKEALPKYATLWQGCYPAEKLPGMDSLIAVASRSMNIISGRLMVNRTV
jgi:hypothetical protein